MRMKVSRPCMLRLFYALTRWIGSVCRFLMAYATTDRWTLSWMNGQGERKIECMYWSA